MLGMIKFAVWPQSVGSCIVCLAGGNDECALVVYSWFHYASQSALCWLLQQALTHKVLRSNYRISDPKLCLLLLEPRSLSFCTLITRGHLRKVIGSSLETLLGQLPHGQKGSHKRE